MDVQTVAVIAVVVAAGSEIMAMTPSLKANSWLQLIVSVLKVLFPKK
jgi:hypothetical protein